MARERWEVPFTVKLEKFIHETYPNSMKPKVFQSEILRIEDDAEEPVKIYMNAPMRHSGFTFFQASWGPENAKPDDKKYTVFAVVKNPSDNWPLIACLAALVGLVLHFGWVLISYIIRIHNKPGGTSGSAEAIAPTS